MSTLSGTASSKSANCFCYCSMILNCRKSYVLALMLLYSEISSSAVTASMKSKLITKFMFSYITYLRYAWCSEKMQMNKPLRVANPTSHVVPRKKTLIPYMNVDRYN